MAHQAQDTFTAELDGVPVFVHKGEVMSDNHALVKHDAAASKDNPKRVRLFKPLDIDEAPKKTSAKADG